MQMQLTHCSITIQYNKIQYKVRNANGTAVALQLTVKKTKKTSVVVIWALSYDDQSQRDVRGLFDK